MNTLVIYLVKAALYLAAFYFVYAILLSRDTTYGRNRAFILISLVLSLILPYFTVYTVKPMNIQIFGKVLNEVFITASAEDTAFSAEKSFSNPLKLIYTIYIAGAAVFLLKFIADLLNLALLISREKIKGSRIIHFRGFNTSGFSAMGYIFINSRLKPEEAAEIIKHEENHLTKKHFFDIIFIELVKAVQWFNPVVYLFNRSLRAIHEFQADQECLCSGVPLVNYQNLLLKQVFKSGTFNLTNSFSNPSLIRKRMIMMTKKRTSNLSNLKQLMAFPAVGIVFMAISAYREAPSSYQQRPDYITVSEKTLSQTSETISLTTGNIPSVIAESLPQAPPPPPPQLSNTNNKETQYTTIVAADATSSAPFVVVEEMPMFPGGDQELLNYIGRNTIYPEDAKKNSITGRVIIRFCVEENGAVNRISVLKGVDPDLDAEAIRVVSTLPAFKPGRQGGKAVPVWYMVPITYALK
jgi:TonB family protein